MNRRELILGAGMVIGAQCVPGLSAAEDETALRKAIADVYSTFYVDFDKQKYRSLLTKDHLLLENGELFDIEGDIALMPIRDSGYKRTDTFDFRSVKVHGDTAYLVYFLNSEIADINGSRKRKWLESAIFRRSGNRWLIAVLHSTRITETGT